MEPGALPRRRLIAAGLCLCCTPTRLMAAASGPMPVREVARGIFVRTGLMADAAPGNDDAIANIGFIVGRDCVAVFDPGGSLADGAALRRAIRNVTSLPIQFVVLSHVHPDHVFGAGAFLADQPVFVGHAKLPEALAARGAFYQQALDRVLGPGASGPVVTPTRLVAQHDSLDLGGRLLSLTAHTPAHSSCDLSAKDSETGIILTGDLLFVRRVPSLDGDLGGWLDALNGLRGSGAAHAVPGHGPPLVMWPAAADDCTRYLTVLRDQTRAAVAAGVPIEKATGTIAQSEQSKWLLFDDYNGHNVIEAYRQLEWE